MFYIRDLIWTDWNVEHIARHGVEAWEVEEAVRNDPHVTRAVTIRTDSSARQTAAGF